MITVEELIIQSLRHRLVVINVKNDNNISGKKTNGLSLLLTGAHRIATELAKQGNAAKGLNNEGSDLDAAYRQNNALLPVIPDGKLEVMLDTGRFKIFQNLPDQPKKSESEKESVEAVNSDPSVYFGLSQSSKQQPGNYEKAVSAIEISEVDNFSIIEFQDKINPEKSLVMVQTENEAGEATTYQPLSQLSQKMILPVGQGTMTIPDVTSSHPQTFIGHRQHTRRKSDPSLVAGLMGVDDSKDTSQYSDSYEGTLGTWMAYKNYSVGDGHSHVECKPNMMLPELMATKNSSNDGKNRSGLNAVTHWNGRGDRHSAKPKSHRFGRDVSAPRNSSFNRDRCSFGNELRLGSERRHNRSGKFEISDSSEDEETPKPQRRHHEQMSIMDKFELSNDEKHEDSYSEICSRILNDFSLDSGVASVPQSAETESSTLNSHSSFRPVKAVVSVQKASPTPPPRRRHQSRSGRINESFSSIASTSATSSNRTSLYMTADESFTGSESHAAATAKQQSRLLSTRKHPPLPLNSQACSHSQSWQNLDTSAADRSSSRGARSPMRNMAISQDPIHINEQASVQQSLLFVPAASDSDCSSDCDSVSGSFASVAPVSSVEPVLPRKFVYEDWMSQLPARLHSVPLTSLAIPGSNVSLAIESDMRVDMNFSKSNLEMAEFLRKLPGLGVFENFRSAMKDIWRAWMSRQTLGIDDQLKAGVRFLEFRISRYKGSIYGEHGLHTRTIKVYLKKIVDFLERHPREVVVIHVSSMANLPSAEKRTFLTTLFQFFGVRMCREMPVHMLTLRFMWTNRKQVVVIFEEEDLEALRHHIFVGLVWPSHLLTIPTPQQAVLKQMREFMNSAYARLPQPDNLVVLKAVLVPDLSMVFGDYQYHSMRQLVQREAIPFLERWLMNKVNLNVVLFDFVGENDLVGCVIRLNQSKKAESIV